MRALIVGDLHGKWEAFEKILHASKLPVFQLGDFGFGFRTRSAPTHHLEWKFIRGNHDSPEKSKENKHYAGDWGTWQGAFFVSGAKSVDTRYRVPGIDYWYNEELNRDQADDALWAYTQTKPNVVFSHDCPDSIKPKVIDYGISRSITGMLLDEMLHAHQPKIWMFGHHHGSYKFKVGGTNFQCLRELETAVIEWKKK